MSESSTTDAFGAQLTEAFLRAAAGDDDDEIHECHQDSRVAFTAAN